MCDFTPVRNWLIALAAAVGLAVSSAFFAWAWSFSKAPWGVIVASISGWAAVTFCTAAIIIAWGPLVGAVSDYCMCCGENKPACVAACRVMRGVIASIVVGFFMIIVGSIEIAIGGSGLDPKVWGPLALGFIATTVGSLLMFAAGMDLATCQTK